MSHSLLLSRSLPTPSCLQPTTYLHHTSRHASLLRRPKRPYTFTQLVMLSDGSTYTHRTTSPAPLYKSSKDTRNSILWNPSQKGLERREEDEGGRLRGFRRRFGRGWDATFGEGEGKDVESVGGEKLGDGVEEGDEDEGLMDLISGFGQEDNQGVKLGGEEGEEKKKKQKGGRA